MTRLTKSEMRKKLQDAIDRKKLERSSKIVKNNFINKHCSENGIDRESIDKLINEQQKNK